MRTTVVTGLPDSMVVRLRASQLAEAVLGRLEGPDAVFDGAGIDSRNLRPGQLFVPVAAARDGHDFVQDALRAGAAAYLTARPPLGGSAVVVEDTTAALARAGRLARSRLPERVVGVTGSVGKTSVKDMLASVLSVDWVTAASLRSFNNELGVPLTLLGAPDEAEAVVVEMGARAVGHVAALCELARPTVAVVTRVAAAHTETFASVEEIALAKAELVEALPGSGTAVLNGADPRVAAMASRTRAAAVRYGVGDVVAEGVTMDAEARPAFWLHSPWGAVEVRLAVRGAHMVENALAAAAAALVCGSSLAAVAGGLGRAAISPWRMAFERLACGAALINDAYNANPTSMAAAIDSLLHLPAARRTAVLGPMAELGRGAEEAHAAIGAMAARQGVRVIAVGCGEYGADVVAPDLAAAVEALGKLGPEDAVLVKGSRVAGLERLVELLRAG